jgi:hypothetical protein
MFSFILLREVINSKCVVLDNTIQYICKNRYNYKTLQETFQETFQDSSP